MNTNKASKRESGQLMIIVALGMVAMFGFAALAVDLGYAYSQRRQAQNAADAASLAGIRMVAASFGTSPPSVTATDVYNEVVRMAGLNGPATVATATFLDVNKNGLGDIQSYGGSLDNVAGVYVDAKITYNTFFAGILGFNSLTSGGNATAMAQGITSITGTGVWPIADICPPPGSTGVDCSSTNFGYEVDEIYTLWDSTMEDAGNAGWLDMNGGNNSAADLASWMDDGFESSGSNPFMHWDSGTGGNANSGTVDDTLPLPSWVAGDTGVRNNNGITSSITGLIGEKMNVLIFDDTASQGANYRYHVIGVLQFLVTDAQWSGGTKYIQGRFVTAVLSGDASGTPVAGSALSTVRLTN